MNTEHDTRAPWSHRTAGPPSLGAPGSGRGHGSCWAARPWPWDRPPRFLLAALMWSPALLYTLVTGDAALREGPFGVFVEPDTLAPGRGWVERGAAAPTLVAVPLLCAGVQGIRTLLRRG